ncbi:RNA endoribonuclease [Komagataella phaffii CBS 7435]|uniref:PIN domain-containing protein n=2 Tax=Komagataella phaffii TaxID=460519 RepID=C4R428_KOMPG|nr:uncharacterized protein PAS_chr3_0275 [Komagataella phaffii GS115]AOA64361.1 GQ67_03328T0 [Komagataella phaffii]CAH2449942.1 RNA endoribonuclease [Komagataella phaffii CBS 7435]AOA68598.1 GQ68_03297T0 [Komagataella phaffii GS115]CAY70314.1 Protein of unknown function [Komagataella phaffii GS115]CCA39893.1 RNA endoribonuclease [Komagataella phaffii CBS 7435]
MNQQDQSDFMDIEDGSELQIITNYVNNQKLTNDFVLSIENDLDSRYKQSKDDTYEHSILFVADTNFVLSHLKLLSQIHNIALTNEQMMTHLKVVIPITTITELDGLKSSSRKEDGFNVGMLARSAVDWIYTHLASNDPIVKGQKLYQRIERDLTPDASILDCALYLQSEYRSSLVVLLSNDKNLCNMALTNQVLTVSYRTGMTAELILSTTFQELQNRGLLDVNNDDHEIIDYEPTVQPADKTSIEDAIATVYSEIKMVALDSLDALMIQEYGDDLEFTGYEKKNIVELSDCFDLISRYGVSTFFHLFKRSRLIDSKMFQRNSATKQKFFKTPPSDAPEFREFVEFWCELLTCLYQAREPSQKKALSQLTARWLAISSRF